MKRHFPTSVCLVPMPSGADGGVSSEMAARSHLSPEKTPARALAVAERLVAALCASVPMTVGSATDRYQTHLREKRKQGRQLRGDALRLRRFLAACPVPADFAERTSLPGALRRSSDRMQPAHGAPTGG